MNNPIISITNLSASYITAGEPVQAVQNISFDIQQGEIFGLVGESGSGKSTVVQAILRTLPPPAVITSGSITIHDKDILSLSHSEVMGYRWKQISIVMQSALNALNPVLTIRDQIRDVLEIHSGLTKDPADKRIQELLSLIDIDVTRLDSYPHQLSGGMRQRIVLAIALALMPPLIIMDEPTTALDVIVEREILSKIIELRKQLGFTILFITHDLNLLLEFADRIGVMRAGCLVELDHAQTIRQGGKHAYTQKLIGSLPVASGPRKKGLLSRPENQDFGNHPILEVQYMSKSFPVSGFFRPKVIEAVQDVSFQVFPGEIVGLVGESGSGKSTIAKLITRLIRPTAGDILLKGTSTQVSEARRVSLEYRRKVQMIFQDPFASLNPRMTVGDIVGEPLVIHKLASGSERDDRVAQMLQKVGLMPEHRTRYPHAFSGGQRQRIGIARALIMQPSLVVCDEAVSALDVSVQAQVINLLQDLQHEFGLTYLFIAHDLSVVKHLCDRVAVMYVGKIAELGETASIFSDPRHPYTRALLAAVPNPDPDVALQATLSGEVADPGNPPPGCSFHPRCGECMVQCKEEQPKQTELTTSHRVWCHVYSNNAE